MKPAYHGTLFDVGPSTAPSSTIPAGESLVDRSALPSSIAGLESDDDASTGADAEKCCTDADERAAWLEVPQARFDSWSVARQLEYCARRDEYSAAHEADNPSWVTFYQHRARCYREALAQMKLEMNQ